MESTTHFGFLGFFHNKTAIKAVPIHTAIWWITFSEFHYKCASKCYCRLRCFEITNRYTANQSCTSKWLGSSIPGSSSSNSSEHLLIALLILRRVILLLTQNRMLLHWRRIPPWVYIGLANEQPQISVTSGLWLMTMRRDIFQLCGKVEWIYWAMWLHYFIIISLKDLKLYFIRHIHGKTNVEWICVRTFYFLF